MKGKIQTVLLVLVLVALLANVVLQVTGIGKSKGLLPYIPLVLHLLMVTVNLGILVTGLAFTVAAWRRRDKSSFRWAAFGFVAALVFIVGLAASPWWLFFDKDPARVFTDLTVALMGLAVPYGFFAYAFYREYVRLAGNHPSDSHRHHRSAPPGPPSAAESES
jgi:hypothetical protein